MLKQPLCAFYNVKVQSRCPNSGWSSWCSPLVINIGNQPVYHSLTLWAFDSYYWYDLNPNVYVDSTFVGTAPVYVQVLEGEHTVSVDESTYNPYSTWTQYLTGFSDALGNGDTRYVYSDYYLDAYYY